MLLKCLSIQQPFAELIMDGRKRVENRSWGWMKDRNWVREGPVLLGIRASTRVAVLDEDELDELFPGWDEDDGPARSKLRIARWRKRTGRVTRTKVPMSLFSGRETTTIA